MNQRSSRAHQSSQSPWLLWSRSSRRLSNFPRHSSSVRSITSRCHLGTDLLTKQRCCPAITLGLPSTLFYPRASGLPNGFSVKETRHARKTTTPQVPPWGSPPRRRRVCRQCSPFQPRPPKTPVRHSETRFPLEGRSGKRDPFRASHQSALGYLRSHISANEISLVSPLFAAASRHPCVKPLFENSA